MSFNKCIEVQLKYSLWIEIGPMLRLYLG